ncbi:S8 family peptidase [Paenibacillus prosopidis]|uniref:Minor extracellular protease Epr n=1 Tax=Paenibacillus prosopidis TaxID=630520 RepID=A0A368VMB4_9BACL|nr:S8 family peptidase [Paenibacillus prosopidis]RCW41581.1 minor extracellular protease Epr [Paenibacillus prosopidis]
MKKAGSFLLIFIWCIMATSLAHGSSVQENNTRYLVSFHTSIDHQLINSLEGKIIKEYRYIPVAVVEISESKAASLKDYSQVEFFEPDLRVNANPELNTKVEPNLKADTAESSPTISKQEVPWGISKINAIEVHKKGFTGKGIRIGIIDSGVDYTHDDLNVVGGVSFVDGASDYFDNYGHGTAVAGIIGAKDNLIGVVGVAPESKLYAIKVLDSMGEGYISDIVSGIEWAVENNLNIVNLSLEVSMDNKVLNKSVKEAYKRGVLLISAAGNMGSMGTLAYPSAYKEVIAVGAINSSNERTVFSGTGKDLELMAPGENVYSTYLNDQYTMNVGTSMASAHVAGVAALIWEANPNLRNEDIREILDKTAVLIGDKILYGYGLVDALKGLNYGDKY